MTARALSDVRPVPRRGLSRTEAAMYIGIGTSLFDELVADGTMPRSVKIGGRKVWDIRELEQIEIFPEVVSPPPVAIETTVIRRASGNPAKEVLVDVRRSGSDGGIYFAGFGNYVKIGRSENVEARIKELQTGSPEKIEVYFVLQEDRISEADFHRTFAQYRTNGEWFRREGALAEFIDRVQEWSQ
jgi:predicted DNA-binding transcriptional regulator AlpA